MGLFYGRRLCLLAFLFCAVSVVAWFASDVMLRTAIIALLLPLTLLFALLWGLRFHRRRILTLLLCLGCALAALLHSLLWISLPRQRVQPYTGEHAVQARIVETQNRADYHTQYLVRLEGIDEEAVGLWAIWSCPDATELAAGDTVYTLATVELCDRNSDGATLLVTSERVESIYVRRTSEEPILDTLRSVGGARILSNRVRTRLCEWLSDQLGAEIGTLSGAFLLGDRSELSLRLTRDFQRAGVSHMMAVSGLHIAILLGSAELVLRRLYVPKPLRCAAVAVLGLIFLFLTGFSLSACRSVLMLFCVYLFFFLREGNDSLTALFSSIALILLVSPHAVADLGMWMSFLATLGLLTFYPLCEKAICRSHKKGMVGGLLRWGRKILLIVLMTVIANLFLFPVIWIFFGELSLIALLANPVLSPVSYVFLLLIPLFMMTFFIPWIGALVRIALLLSGHGMIALVELFSQIPNATVSLRYGFCYILIPLLAISMTVLLAVRLRHKRWLILPGALAVLSFGICLGMTHMADRSASLTVISDFRENDHLAVTDGDQFFLCDASGGSVSAFRQAWNQYQETTATEMAGILLTHCHERHLTGLDWLLQKAVVRRLYLPTPQDEASRALAAKIYVLASELDTEVIFYDTGESLALTDRVSLLVKYAAAQKEHPQYSMSFCGETSVVTYLSPDMSPTAAQLRLSPYLIFGSHGSIPRTASPLWLPEEAQLHTVTYLHPSSPKHDAFFEAGVRVHGAIEKQSATAFSIPLP